MSSHYGIGKAVITSGVPSLSMSRIRFSSFFPIICPISISNIRFPLLCKLPLPRLVNASSIVSIPYLINSGKAGSYSRQNPLEGIANRTGPIWKGLHLAYPVQRYGSPFKRQPPSGLSGPQGGCSTGYALFTLNVIAEKQALVPDV